MVGYTAGSVSAEIKLDTTKFKKAIEEVKKEIESLNGSFKGANIESIANDVEKLKKEVNGLKDSSKTVKDLTGKTNKLEDAVKKTSKSVEQLNKAYKSSNQSAKTQQKNLDSEIKKNKQLKDATKAAEKTVETLNKERANTVKTSKKEQQTLDNTIKKTQQEIKVNEQLNKSLKKTEVQTKKTVSSLQKSFTKDFYNLTAAASKENKGVLLQPVYNQLKKKYKPQVKNRKEFEKLFANATLETNTRLYPTRDPQKFVKFGEGVHSKNWGYIDAKHIKKPFQEVKKEIKSTEQEIDKLYSKKIDLDTHPIIQDKKVIDETKKSINQLNKETQKTGSSKGVKQFLTEFAKADTGIKRTTQETENLIRNFASLNRTNAQSQQSVANATKKAVNETVKAREENIKSAAKEAQIIKEYTMDEIKFMRKLDSSARFYRDNYGETLRPIDKKNYSRTSYSQMLRSHRRDNGFRLNRKVWNEYIESESRDFTTPFQKRIKELAGDLGITVSDVIDEEYKKVRDKSTGKMVEYWDTSKVRDNSEWLYKVESQLNSLKRVKKEISSLRRVFKGDILGYMFPEKLKKEIDSHRRYEMYSRGEKNPFFEKYLRDEGLIEYYKQGQRDLDKAHYFDFQLEKANTALNTFDRGLKSTQIDLNKFDNTWKVTSDQVRTACGVLRTAETNISGVGKSLNSAETSGWSYATTNRKLTNALNQYNSTVAMAKGLTSKTSDEIRRASAQQGAFSETTKRASVALDQSAQSVKRWSVGFKKVPKAFTATGQFLKNLTLDLSTRGKISNNIIFDMTRMAKENERYLKTTKVDVEGFNQIYKSLGSTISSNNFHVQNALNVLKLYDGGVEKSKQRLKEYEIQTKKTFETMQVELAKANAAQYKYWKQVRGQSSRQQIVSQVGKEQIKWDTTSFNKQPLQIQGYNDYLVKIEEINTALEKWKKTQQTINDLGKYTSENFVKASEGLNLLNQQIEKSNAIINKNQQSNAKLGSQIQRLNTQINHLSGSSGKNFRAFEEVSIQVKQLENRYNSLNNKLKTGKVTNEQYAASMEKMEKEFSELYTKTQLVNRGLQQSGKGVDKFGKGTKNAAHSSRILSNTLYQIRGALLSLKMIFTAMGGMALWGFGMQLVEEVKDTVTARNEMVAQLNQNSKIDASGIQYFTKSLDDLTKQYKKVNKYSIGETVSSLGIEFNLTAEEMKKAMPIITMVQSEYIRAGRTPEEAALAVKDILQGEFQRLSRETGVGKEELIAYGWNGKKEDLNSLLKAVEKAGKSRHWDVFAKKATSLNDVLTITQSRFSETGAELLDSATPMIVEAFNMLIGGIEGVSTSFANLNPFWQNFALWGGGSAVLGGILTALPMVTKGMGLADIATIGWGKSIATAALNLNKAEVAQYGFRKALAATITGTKASELSTMRSSKAILGRVMGLDAVTLKEKGWLGSMVKNKASLKEGIELTAKDSAYTMSRAKKLAYLTTNIDLNTAKSLKQGEAIRKVATSWRIWRTVLAGITGIAIIGWLASLGMQADLVKKRIEAFNEVIATGKDKLKEAKSQLKTYKDQMEKYQKGTVKYDRAKANKGIMEGTVEDLKTARRIAKAYKKQNEAREESITLAQKQFMAEAYRKAGNDPAAATEKASGYTEKVRQAQYEITRSYNEQYNWLYKSSQHINEKVKGLKAEGVEQKKINKYIGEYALISEEAGEHLKQFYQGDLQAGAYFALDQLKLAWIDLWNDSHFLNFWKSVQNTWKGLQPQIKALTKSLGDLGHFLLDVFSTDIGQTVLKIGAFGVAVGLAAKKLAGWGSAIKSTILGLKDLGSALINRIRDWNNYRKAKEKAEEADVITGKGKGKTTGGTVPDGTGKGKEVESLSKQLKADAQRYVRAGVAIFAGMMLITEAIVLIRAPMAAVAEQGWQFKQWEPEIRKGIEGLKLMAPVLLTFLPPVIALVTVMGKFGEQISSSTILKGAGKAAIGIAAGMLLIAEAIALITPSIWALGYLGGEYQGLETQVKKGTEAMKTVADSLNYLAPFIPMIAIAVGSIALLFTGGGAIVGGIALASLALGIPAGMLLVAETIWSLEYPLGQIAALGGKFDNIDEIKSGARAIELASEAMESVQKALANMVLIKWDLIANAITDLVGKNIGTDLTSLTKEDGFFDQLSTFTNEFNDKVQVTPINSDKITALSNVNTGLTSIGNVLKNTKTAIDNLPPEMKNNQQMNISYDMETDKTTVKGSMDNQNYFDQLKQPLQDLAAFVKEFNSNPVYDMGEGISQDKIDAVTSAANMIGQLDSAVKKIQSVMGASALTGAATQVQTNGAAMLPGALGLIANFVTGGGTTAATGSYVSSFGSSFQEMENILKDLSTFSNNVSGLGTSGEGSGPDVEGLASFVAAVSKNINDLKTTLSTSVPAIKTNATNIGKGVVSGIKDGLSGLNNIGSSIPPKLANGIMVNKETLYKTSNSLGKTSAKRFQEGVNIMSNYMFWELSYVKQAMTDRQTELGNTAYNLGSHIASRFKEGDDINSPGIMARSMQDEVSYIGNALNVNNLPQMAYNLANAMSSNFNLDFGLSNIQLPDVSQFTSKLSVIPSTVANVKTQVSTNFNAMKAGISGAFTNIISKTRGSMGNMLSATTKNIGAIRTSWRGMQTALIASAENIKSQTSSKINKLKTNLGNFWNKLKHPDQLIGSSAGGHTGSIRRRSHAPRIRAYAGGSNSYPSSNKDTDFIKQYLQCLSQGGNCYAGGWNFNWNKNIQGKFNGWNTHFGKWNLDNHLRVGKFNNTSSPIANLSQSNRAAIAKDYIFDVINNTDYSKYFNSKFGEDPVAALRAGAFNCWDGTNVILGIASAFGLKGERQHGTWNGIGHVWANIPGIGIMDPTAIQKLGTLKSSSVRGYSAGSIRRGEAKQKLQTGNTTNHNEEVHIHIHGDVYGVDDLDNRIEEGAKRVQRRLYTNSLSGV